MRALQCGQISKEESEFLRRSCSARMPVGIMGTLHGKASAPSAGEREHVKPEPRDKTQGKHLSIISLSSTADGRWHAPSLEK